MYTCAQCSPVWEEAREAAAERLMVGRGAPRVAKPKLDALEWGEGDSGRGTAGEERSGFAYLHINSGSVSSVYAFTVHV